MSWDTYRNEDRQEQEQLEVIRAQIEDATKDTLRWLQANPTAEERVHVLAIQELLADLGRIIERRMERRKLPKDELEYSETASEVVSLLDKAREVRGNIVGKGLARLADHLPKGLPGSKVRLVAQALAQPKRYRLPAPVRPVSTALTSSTLSSREPKPTQVPPSPPTYFPSDLWPKTYVILLEARKKFPYQTQTLELCKHIISEMTPLFYWAVVGGTIKAGAVFNEGLGGMEDLLHSLLVHNDDWPKSGFSSLSDQAYRLGQVVRQSDEWLKLAKAIEDAQEGQGLFKAVADAEMEVFGQNFLAPANSAQNVETKPTDRRAMVDAYIQDVRSKKSKRITRKDIWSAAGYQTRTEFERWERQDEKHPNQAADETFTRILSVEKPHLK